MSNDNKKVKVVSIGDYKEKVQEKAKWIKEFEEGSQPIAGCTCGEHTDPNQFLTEKQVTKHYLKDRKRYVEGLKGEDPLEIYMETFKDLMDDSPLVKLNMETDLAMMAFISNYFHKGMKFYKQYIKNKLSTREDTLDTYLNETEGYIKFMEKHFSTADMIVSEYILSITAKNLYSQINDALDGNHTLSSEVDTLGVQMQESLDEIKRTISHNRKRDLRIIKDKYDEVKDSCSVEYKAKTLIDIELRNREINGWEYIGQSKFTVNNSTRQLIESIGMENLIMKLSTKELTNLFQQLKTLEE